MATKTKVKKFDPASLSLEDQGAVVEHYMGCHPKYYVYEGHKLKVDLWKMEHNGIYWGGYFKPHAKELNL